MTDLERKLIQLLQEQNESLATGNDQLTERIALFTEELNCLRRELLLLKQLTGA